MSYYETDTCDRAVEKYFAENKRRYGADVPQPNRDLVKEVERCGKRYVLIANVNGLLAVYKVREEFKNMSIEGWGDRKRKDWEEWGHMKGLVLQFLK